MKINTPNTEALKAYTSQSTQNVQFNHKDKETPNSTKTPASLSADRVNISSTVKLMKDIVTAVKESPDIRPEKIKEVSSKIEMGAYEPDLNAVAGKLLSPNMSDRI